ncbi:hypothetical protein IE077_000448 [Cardiosporidium cionae]|uniref:ribonuclease Z n=1 Tax=Cardiosporidium cionae TaxID=476202 RepID=A0ABQ7J9B4_9APIC|nr:hypothetical protein IE077_000448 [Cardiosporidium cionae]|eukprot:KAF8820595.1 hypothetical protein IE077_000448 [Cardiosporidium cionae]
MEIVLKTLGWHEFGVPSSLQLFCNGDRYLFNCGENCNRFHLEHKLHLARTKYIFLTSLSVRTMGGLLGTLLSIEMAKIPQICVVGPKHTRQLINAMRQRISKLMTIQIDVNEVIHCKKEYQLFPDLRLWAIPLTVPYPIISKQEEYLQEMKQTMHSENSQKTSSKEVSEEFSACKRPREAMNDSVELENIESLIEEEVMKKSCVEKYSILYHLQMPSTIGKFDTKAAEALKIPKGRLYGQLKAGLTICLEDGTFIYPHQVCGETQKGISIVLYEHIENSFSLPLIENYFRTVSSSPRFFFHVGPSSVCYTH